MKNVLDRIEGFHQLNERRHRGGGGLGVRGKGRAWAAASAVSTTRRCAACLK